MALSALALPSYAMKTRLIIASNFCKFYCIPAMYFETSTNVFLKYFHHWHAAGATLQVYSKI